MLQDAREMRLYLHVNPDSNKHLKRNSASGELSKRSTKFNPRTLTYLNHAWDVGKNTINRMLKAQANNADGNKDPKKNSSREMIIDSMEAAKARITPKSLFMANRVKQRHRANEIYAYDSIVLTELAYEYREEAKAEWVLADSDTKEYWEAVTRKQLARQPMIRDYIIESLRQNPSKSYHHVAEDTGNWCSKTTIQKWLDSHGCTQYAQRSLPLLTDAQRKKHVDFCRHILNTWGLPRQKYLLVNYDEKWFFGWVCRVNAKKCELLGLEKSHTYLYHKGHIDKVMAVAFTAYAFDQNMENGGKGLKLGLYRVQAARIAKKTVRESRRDEEGRIRYDGNIVREKGDAYLIDCNVTGSNAGTSDKPKFSLKSLFEDQMFPKVAELVGSGGEFEGYLPVFQGDNAGPHIDSTFHNYVNGHCEAKGWKWEPQAPQMPHMNNLDLAVFPAMSKRHSELLQRYSNRMAPPEEIWNACEAVWRDLPSASIARGFILQSRIAAKVIEYKGANTFLQTQNFHSGVRRDFADTKDGVIKKVYVMH